MPCFSDLRPSRRQSHCRCSVCLDLHPSGPSHTADALFFGFAPKLTPVTLPMLCLFWICARADPVTLPMPCSSDLHPSGASNPAYALFFEISSDLHPSGASHPVYALFFEISPKLAMRRGSWAENTRSAHRAEIERKLSGN